MQVRFRKQLERASRVLVFCREHPSDLAGYQQAVTRLEEQLVLADQIVGQAKAGGTATKEAMAERNQLRAEVNAQLRLLARIARSAGQEAIGTPIVISFPNPGSSFREFGYGARQAIAAAKEREEVLVKYGLAPDFLASITSRLEEMERWLTRRDEALQSRVYAHRDLQAVISLMVLTVAQLHAVNSYRFRGEPAALRTWTSASSTQIGPRKVAEGSEPEPAVLSLPPGTAK